MASTTILSDNGASSGSAGIKTTGGNDGVLLLQTTTTGGAATTALTIDTSQNVGLGVTPSAWRTVYKALQTNGGSVYGFTSNDRIGMVQNGYVDATSLAWTYVATAAASRYDQLGGVHAWYTAASGTAGNAISFTQAMTLDASGNLGVGTSTPTTVGGIALCVYDSATPRIRLTSSTTGNASTDGGELSLYGSDFIIENREAGSTRFYVNGSQRMCIDSGGGVVINDTTQLSSAPLSVWSSNAGTVAAFRSKGTGTQRGLYVGIDNSTGIVSLDATGATGGILSFRTGSSEGAQLDTSSNFKFDSGYGSVATAYGCRAWVNFNGATFGVNGSGNLSSLTDVGVGNYIFNFATAMPDTNYSASGLGRWNADTNTHSCTIQQRLSSTKSTTAFEFWVINGVNGSSFAAMDSPNVSVQFFR